MCCSEIWIQKRHVLWWLPVIVLVLLTASAGATTTPCADKYNPDTPINAKYQVSFDESTVWQVRGGTVSFTITGLDPQKPENGTIVACLRSEPTDPNQPNNWSGSLPLVPNRIDNPEKKNGITFAVTIPEDGSWYLAPFYPTLKLRVIVSEPTDSPPIVLDVIREIKISPPWFAALLSVLFVIVAGVVLSKFAIFLEVPGTNIFLRIISTAKGWASLAQFQIILWTLVIGAGAVYVMALRGSLIQISGGVLQLLGIAGVATVSSQIKSSQQTQSPSTLLPPGQINNLSYVQGSLGTSEVTLTWLVPTSGGMPSAYTIQFKPKNKTSWFTASSTVTKTKFMLVGLQAQTEYDVQVFATNSSGSGVPMINVVTTHVDNPTQYSLPTVKGLRPNGKVTADTVPLAWDFSMNNIQYKVEYRVHDSDETWQTYSVSNATTTVMLNLKANTAYDFRVYATDNAKRGPYSDICSVITGTRIPRWSDIVTETTREAEIDVTRVQMLFFTVITACFVTIKIVSSSIIPEIPETYVTLMGISNGVYITAKFFNR